MNALTLTYVVRGRRFALSAPRRKRGTGHLIPRSELTLRASSATTRIAARKKKVETYTRVLNVQPVGAVALRGTDTHGLLLTLSLIIFFPSRFQRESVSAGHVVNIAAYVIVPLRARVCVYVCARAECKSISRDKSGLIHLLQTCAERES